MKDESHMKPKEEPIQVRTRKSSRSQKREASADKSSMKKKVQGTKKKMNEEGKKVTINEKH